MDNRTPRFSPEFVFSKTKDNLLSNISYSIEKANSRVHDFLDNRSTLGEIEWTVETLKDLRKVVSILCRNPDEVQAVLEDLENKKL